MNRNTIKLIAGIIEGTLLKGQSVALRELLWSVDSQLHVIISAEEINEALRLAPPVKITRLDGRAELVPTTERAEDGITEADIKIAATDYNDYVSSQIEKLRGKKSR
jgi:hypothetical protein